MHDATKPVSGNYLFKQQTDGDDKRYEECDLCHNWSPFPIHCASPNT